MFARIYIDDLRSLHLKSDIQQALNEHFSHNEIRRVKKMLGFLGTDIRRVFSASQVFR